MHSAQRLYPLRAVRGETMFQDAIPRTQLDTATGAPQDGMHLGPEGPLATEFRRFFWWYAKETDTGPAQIDEQVHLWAYHESEKCCLMPSLRHDMFAGATFDPTKKLKCTAAQGLTLARNIVQIFAQDIERHNLQQSPQWLSLVHLCTAWRMLMLPVLTLNVIIQVLEDYTVRPATHGSFTCTQAYVQLPSPPFYRLRSRSPHGTSIFSVLGGTLPSPSIISFFTCLYSA